MKNFVLSCICFICGFRLIAQTDSTKLPIVLGGYLEAYYSYDFNDPDDHNKPDFIYSYNRHNEVNINLGLIKASYEKQQTRANLGLMVGTYPNANLRSEPGVLKNINEVNIGVKISRKNNTWIDAGIFPSHIGFESAIGKDCWNLTRSLLAENSPYYESGIKLSHTSKNSKWFLSALILNGWQHIQRSKGNNTPAFGHQLIYKPNDKITLNSSSFLGNDKPDSSIQMRYFHNFYGQFQLNNKLGLIIGFDYGTEQKLTEKGRYNEWYSPILILRYSINSRFKLAVRGEYFSDKQEVIISTNAPHGAQIFGCSLNFDYSIADNLVWRIEGRVLRANDVFFTQNNNLIRQNISATSSLALSF